MSIFPFVARIANDFEQINGLFDDTLNAICHQIQAYTTSNIQAYTTSNESFTYSQMLREIDHAKFFEAMEIKINDHEARRHWDLMLRTDLPLGSKIIMAIWSFKRDFPMECLINTRPDYVLTEVNKLGVKTTGIPMLQSLHGLVFDFCSLWLRFMASNLKASLSFCLQSIINSIHSMDLCRRSLFLFLRAILRDVTKFATFLAFNIGDTVTRFAG